MSGNQEETAMDTYTCDYCGAEGTTPDHHNAHGPCPGGMMDPAMWDEFRSSVIEGVTRELDRVWLTVASMEPMIASFESSIQVGGNGHFRTGFRVDDTPLFFEDDAD